MRPLRAIVLVICCAVAQLPALAGVESAAAALPQRWVYHADVDGDGANDRVVLTADDDLTVHQRVGSGHYRLRVRFADGTVAARRMHVDYYYSGNRGGWTPWYGATQIDHVRGQELVLGRTSGAHTAVFAVVTLRQHRLRVLDPPYTATASGPGWVVNSSVGTGSQGWRCTDRGVQSWSITPNSDGSRYRIERTSYLLRVTWHRTHFTRYSVPADDPPANGDDYPTFSCPGLPDTF